VIARRARTGEGPALSALAQRAYAHYVERIGLRPMPMDTDYAAKIEADDVWVLDDGAIAGYVILVAEPDHLLVENVAVDPAHQGRGLGRRLMALAEVEARERGLAELRLFTHVAMTENRAIYARLGYTETEIREEPGFTRVFMAKPVAPHPALPALPEWPVRSIGILSTLGAGCPHAIPVSAPLRAGDRSILVNLRGDRRSLTRLRADPAVALTVLAEGDVAFTARGTARVLDEPLAGGYAAVAIDVEHIDDHRQEAFTVTGGVAREWVDPAEQKALGERVAQLKRLVR